MGEKATRKGKQEGSKSATVRSQVAGQALLSIQVVDPRYTVERVIKELNARELKYAAGQISRANHVVARYHIQEVNDYLENFRISA